jgi:hypothetical protein
MDDIAFAPGGEPVQKVRGLTWYQDVQISRQTILL